MTANGDERNSGGPESVIVIGTGIDDREKVVNVA